ncbi:hypothetical protein BKA83DRAFT_94608, partial [Pisolithus microcarpus]
LGFVDMLNLLRWGVTSSEVVQAFRALARPVSYTDGIGPTELYPLRAEVERANRARLDALPGSGTRYDATDTPGINSYGEKVSIPQMERLLDRLVAPRSILLKAGAQVMLIKVGRFLRRMNYRDAAILENLVQGQLVNGSVGQVIGFRTAQEASQSLTDIGTEEGLKGNKAEALRAVTRYNDAKWPVVRFTNGRELLCVPTEFTVNNANGEIEASRWQVCRRGLL